MGSINSFLRIFNFLDPDPGPSGPLTGPLTGPRSSKTMILGSQKWTKNQDFQYLDSKYKKETLGAAFYVRMGKGKATETPWNRLLRKRASILKKTGKSQIFDGFFIDFESFLGKVSNFSRAGWGCTKSQKFQNRQNGQNST